jgi:glucosamine--fructose-6-phosphate aminotransferase (isomerizing)
MAGEEMLISSKTYLNSVALIWLIARQWSGVCSGDELQTLSRMADRVEAVLAQRTALTSRLMETFDVDRGVLFVGHGPAAATARQAAMTLSEWAKVPARYASVAAFRHGFIEAVEPGLAAVVIAPPGATWASALGLARELAGYGAVVLVLQNGQLFSPEGGPAAEDGVDEFLSPLLDIIPVQLYAQALVEARGITPGFRYISKVVKNI